METIEHLIETNLSLIDYLKNSRLFNHLPTHKLEKLVPLSDIKQLDRKTVVIKEGEPNDKIYILLRGSVGVYIEGEFIIELKRQGDIFGEMSIISNKSASATVIAETSIMIFSIQAKNIGTYTEFDTSDVQNTLYRIFAMILTDKLTLTSHKAKHFEQEHKKVLKTHELLKESNENLTKQKEQLILAKKQAEFANQTKNEFLANISHEIRTPLHHILSFSQFGISKTNSASKSKLISFFKKIKNSSDKVLILLNDILDLSKLESGKMNYTFKGHHLKHLIRTVKEEFSSIINEKEIKVNLVGLKESATIDCDDVRISQVLRNLLSNAIKFTESGKKITIKVSNTELPSGRRSSEFKMIEAVKVSIKDEGVGIPQDELKSVFEKYKQSKINTKESGGTGLGLAIAFEIITAHRGKIWAESHLSGGTQINFILPIQQTTEH